MFLRLELDDTQRVSIAGLRYVVVIVALAPMRYSSVFLGYMSRCIHRLVDSYALVHANSGIYLNSNLSNT